MLGFVLRNLRKCQVLSYTVPVRSEVSVNCIMQDIWWNSLSSRRSSARLTMFHKAIKGDVAIPIDELKLQNRTPEFDVLTTITSTSVPTRQTMRSPLL